MSVTVLSVASGSILAVRADISLGVCLDFAFATTFAIGSDVIFFSIVGAFVLQILSRSYFFTTVPNLERKHFSVHTIY